MEPTATTPEQKHGWRWHRLKYLVLGVCTALVIYLLVAYVVLPIGWWRYTRHHPGLDDVSGVTLTKDGMPGDPLNVALVVDEARVKAVMQAAGWDPADPLSLRSDVKIAVDDFHKIRAGRNGGGDPWRTDGRLAVADVTEPP